MTKKQVNQVLGKAATAKLDLKDPAATEWLAKNLARIRTSMNQKTFLEEQNKKMRRVLMPGKMFFFGYSPMTKEELMFWDEFPIVLCLHMVDGGFLGLNFHYLPPVKRSAFINNLLKNVGNQNWSEYDQQMRPKNPDSRIRVGYPILKNKSELRLFKYCIKRYYLKQIVTNIAFIPPTEWKTVPFFPLDRFRGATKANVWSLAR